jgi:hypothetical protein
MSASTFPETSQMLQAMRVIAEEDFRAHVAACATCSTHFILGNCDPGWALLVRLAHVRTACLLAPEEANASSH